MSSSLVVADNQIDPELITERDGVFWYPARQAGEQPASAVTPYTKTALNPRSHATIVDYVAKGHFLTSACRAVGISDATVRYWLKKGSPVTVVVDGEQLEVYPDNAYGRFKIDYDKASFVAENRAVEAVTKSFDDDWRAPMEFLARRFPADWSQKHQVEVTVAEDERVAVARQELFDKLDAIHAGVAEVSSISDGEIIDAEVIED